MNSLINLMVADNFFFKEDIQTLNLAIDNGNFIDKDYGEEIPCFHLIIPNANKIFSEALSCNAIVDENQSGIFRRPMSGIHFESFERLTEWCFVISISDKETLFNTYTHRTGIKDATQEYRLNYKNLLDWNLNSSFVLKQNQGIFFRPWLFHSFEQGIVQYYKILIN